MRRTVAAAAIALLAAGLHLPAGADHDADLHSPNMSLIANFNDESTYAAGSDIGFWGNRAVFGNLSPGGFRLLDISNPTRPHMISNFECEGSQSDVSIWEDLVFVSVDTAQFGPECGAGAASLDQFVIGNVWEGVRIVSIADPTNPRQIAAVDTDCGSHTHTLVPDVTNGRLLLYVQSYPLTNHSVECNPVSHRKISVIEVPLDDPASASVISTPSVSPSIGCHDVTVFLERKLAAAACISESQLWDISDPANPVILSSIVNPLINIHHSSGFSWDGNTIVLGDELGGAAAAPGCLGLGVPLGALWFYDVSDPANPVEMGSYLLPRQAVSELCTAHNFNLIPLTDGRDLLVSAWYTGGTTVVDFTDPANPQEIGYYVAEGGITWSSYFYNGYVYANNYGDRGIDVLRLDEPSLAARVPLTRMNAQTQEPLPAASGAGSGSSGSPSGGTAKPKQEPKVLGGGTGALPGTGVSGAPMAGVGLLALAALLAARTRRV
jgi:hypothetical protein